MNKIKMGEFLKELRTKKGLSQPDLAREFAKDFLDVSTNAISSWEKGKSIPDIDKLNFLANFYDVTVDDILDGQKYIQKDFNEIYHFHQSDYFVIRDFAIKRSDADKFTEPVFYSTTEEAKLIRSRFKKLILNFVKEDISRGETEELRFIIKNYFVLDDDYSITKYFEILRKLRNKKISNEEKWWEINKYLTPIRTIRLSLANVSDDFYKDPSVQCRMDFSEQWEKDLLLAAIQVADPIFRDPNVGNSKYIEEYEKEHGKPFNKEEITKNVIRYLINNGAAINENFLSFEEGETYSSRVIDSLENLYKKYKKPISVCVKKEGKLHFYLVENNSKNRLFSNYDYYLVKPLKKLGYTNDEIFPLIYENKIIPDEVYIRAAKLEGIDTNREIRFIKADLQYRSDMPTLKHYWPEYYEIEHPNDSSWEDDLKVLESKLLNKEYICYKTEYHLEGGTNEFEKFEFIKHLKSLMSFDEFQKGRNIAKTKELLESLDSLTVQQIREKYFNFGGQIND